MSTSTAASNNSVPTSSQAGAAPQQSAQKDSAPKSGRNRLGQFAKGHPGGPGNPYARQVAKLKAAMLQTIDEVKLAAYIERLYEWAMDGNLPAGKLLLSYLLGKPVPTSDPDQVGIHEWDILCQEADIFTNMMHVAQKPESEVVLDTARAGRQGMSEWFADQFRQAIHLCNEEDRKEAELKAKRKAKREEKARQQKQAEQQTDLPSPNRNIGNDAPLPKRSNGNDSPLPKRPNGNQPPLPKGNNGNQPPSPNQPNGNDAPLPKGINGPEAPLPKGINANDSPLPKGTNGTESPSPNGKSRGLMPNVWPFRQRTE